MKSVKEADMDNNRFKPFSTTLMGSMPRSKELLDLKEKKHKKMINMLRNIRKKYIQKTEKDLFKCLKKQELMWL